MVIPKAAGSSPRRGVAGTGRFAGGQCAARRDGGRGLCRYSRASQADTERKTPAAKNRMICDERRSALYKLS